MTPEQTARFRDIVALMGKLLIARKDTKAIETRINGQWGWIPDRERVPRGEDPNSGALIPMRMSDFEEHMTGKRCMGTYLLDSDSRTKFVAFDIDLKTNGEYLVVRDTLAEIEAAEVAGVLDLDLKVGDLETALHRPDLEPHRWARILLNNLSLAITMNVAKLGLPTLTVLTGGGMHVLVPFGEPIPAADARRIGADVMEALGHVPTRGDNFWITAGASEHPPVEVEIFPKQDKNQGFGNLIRLPLGWHAGARVRTAFVDRTNEMGAPWDIKKMPPLDALEGAATQLGV